jgi:hypothetical protein
MLNGLIPFKGNDITHDVGLMSGVTPTRTITGILLEMQVSYVGNLITKPLNVF